MNLEARQELELIRSRNKDGILFPEDVVKFARNSKTALHKFFEWDDNKAAENYRLAQARSIIRVTVEIIGDVSTEPVRTYVSLPSDRKSDGGYRHMAEVVEDQVMLEELFAEAQRELEAFRKKYQKLAAVSEMRGVFREIQGITKIRDLFRKMDNNQRIDA